MQQTKLPRLKVLIADDILETRRTARIMLSQNPLVEVVATASNGVQAIKKAETFEPDILLMDIHMPGLDGISAIYAIREILPDAAFVVISAERDQQTIRDVRALGVLDYLVKPFTIDQLEIAMEHAVKKCFHSKQKNFPQAKPDLALMNTAREVIQKGQTDEEAMLVLEELASVPDCPPYLLAGLARIYADRAEWAKLRNLSERLEKLGR